MITSKDDFYELLWNDFISLPEEDRHECFLYRFLKRKKDSRAEIIGRDRDELFEYSARKKIDKYILLKSAYFAFSRCKVITADEYRDFLQQLSGRKNPVSDNKEAEKIQQRLERKFLLGCVSDYFYNLGYRTNKRDEHGMSTKLDNRHRRDNSYTDEFEMLFEYSREFGENFQSSETAHDVKIDDEFIEKCTRLYNSMLKEKRADAFVSLFVDSETGAGVYIIGQSQLGAFVEKPDGKTPCSIYIISFLSVDNYQNDGYNNHTELSISMSVLNKYKTVKEAFSDFVKMTETKKFFENFPDENLSGILEQPPAGADSRFEPYFVSKETREYSRKKALVEKLRQKEIQAQAELKEIYSHKRR